MIPVVKQISSEKDWDLYMSDGKILLKFRGDERAFEFRRTIAERFSTELEQLLRPYIFNAKEDKMDFSKFID